jgi:hypothetical protein
VIDCDVLICGVGAVGHLLEPPHREYQARKWPIDAFTITQWGGPPTLRFLLAGTPIVKPDCGRPAHAIRPHRTSPAQANVMAGNPTRPDRADAHQSRAAVHRDGEECRAQSDGGS